MGKAKHRAITEKAFFIIFFSIIAALGVLKITKNSIVDNTIATAVALALSITLTKIVFFLERRSEK